MKEKKKNSIRTAFKLLQFCVNSINNARTKAKTKKKKKKKKKNKETTVTTKRNGTILITSSSLI